jgi:FeS assembly protein IscX
LPTICFKIKLIIDYFLGIFMNWTDSLEIAIALDEAHPDTNPLTVGFVDLREMVMALAEFEDEAEKSGEKILEAIQMNWIEERE